MTAAPDASLHVSHPSHGRSPLQVCTSVLVGYNLNCQWSKILVWTNVGSGAGQ